MPEAEEAVNLARDVEVLDADAGLTDAGGEGLAFVVEGIAGGGEDHGGWKGLQQGGVDGGDLGIEEKGAGGGQGEAKVLLPEPAHAVVVRL